MATASTDLYSVDIPIRGEFCTVRYGVHRQTYLTTKAELAAALMSDPDAELQSAIGGSWLDLLATHGFALKQVGNIVSYILYVKPEMRHIVYHRAEGGDPLRLDITYPPILMAFRFVSKRLQVDYVHSRAYIIDPLKVGQLRIDNTDHILHYFPYGNVFSANAGICWGSSETNRLTPTDPLAVVHTFFESPFNSHLWTQVTHTHAGMVPPTTRVPTLPKLVELSAGILKWPGAYPTSITEVARDI